MTPAQMQDALLAANTALVEKLGHQPYLRLSLNLYYDNWQVGGAYTDPDLNTRIAGPSCDTPEAAFDGIMEVIRKILDEKTRNLREFHKKVADAIDFGNQHGIDTEWVNPLEVMSRKLSSNALEVHP